MNTKIKMSLRNKLFLVTLSILFINVIIVLAFSGTFLDKFLLMSTKRKLNEYHYKIIDAYNDNNIALSNDILNKCAQNNMTVLIYDMAKNKISYSTARGKDGEPKGGIDPMLWIDMAYKKNIFALLEKSSPIIVNEENQAGNSIYLYSKATQNTYLFMETPREFIENTSTAAMGFFIVLSTATFIVGAIALYIIVKKMTHPIEEIDKTAQEIAKMNFSKRCEVHTKDELEVLANNINIMASHLEKNIGLLKKDLQREEKTNLLRREFIANVTHDLKTPLTLIIAYSEALKEDRITKSEATAVLMDQAQNINDLVNKTLTLSRLESKTTRYNFNPFQIGEMIYSVIDSFKLIIKDRGIKLNKEIDQSLIVNGDYNYLKQAFANYIENAIKYVEKNKEIDVICKKEGQKIKVEVKNTHNPIEEENISNLFEMFYKVDRSRNKSTNSYGIGLAIVKNIIEGHGGEVGAYYEENKMCFYFILNNFEY